MKYKMNVVRLFSALLVIFSINSLSAQCVTCADMTLTCGETGLIIESEKGVKTLAFPLNISPRNGTSFTVTDGTGIGVVLALDKMPDFDSLEDAQAFVTDCMANGPGLDCAEVLQCVPPNLDNDPTNELDDTDISGVTTSFDGTDLTVTVTEDGVDYSDDVDLSELISEPEFVGTQIVDDPTDPSGIPAGTYVEGNQYFLFTESGHFVEYVYDEDTGLWASESSVQVISSDGSVTVVETMTVGQGVNDIVYDLSVPDIVIDGVNVPLGTDIKPNLVQCIQDNAPPLFDDVVIVYDINADGDTLGYNAEYLDENGDPIADVDIEFPSSAPSTFEDAASPEGDGIGALHTNSDGDDYLIAIDTTVNAAGDTSLVFTLGSQTLEVCIPQKPVEGVMTAVDDSEVVTSCNFTIDLLANDVIPDECQVAFVSVTSYPEGLTCFGVDALTGIVACTGDVKNGCVCDEGDYVFEYEIVSNTCPTVSGTHTVTYEEPPLAESRVAIGEPNDDGIAEVNFTQTKNDGSNITGCECSRIVIELVQAGIPVHSELEGDLCTPVENWDLVSGFDLRPYFTGSAANGGSVNWDLREWAITSGYIDLDGANEFQNKRIYTYVGGSDCASGGDACPVESVNPDNFAEVCRTIFLGSDNQAFNMVSDDGTTRTFTNYSMAWNTPAGTNPNGSILGSVISAASNNDVIRLLQATTGTGAVCGGYWDVRHTAADAITLVQLDITGGADLTGLSTVLTNSGGPTWSYPSELAPAITTNLPFITSVPTNGLAGTNPENVTCDGQVSNWMGFTACYDVGETLVYPNRAYFDHVDGAGIPIELNINFLYGY